MTTNITILVHGNSLRKKLNRRLNDAYGFQRTSGGKHTTISLSIAECKSVIAALDERLALVESLEKAQRANAAQDDHINQQQDRIDQLEKGHQEAAKQINSWRRMAKQNIAEREKDIAELDAARQRIAGLESRTVTVKLPDINEYLAEVHDKTLNRAFRLLAEGVRAGDVAAMRAAGIKVEAE
ncbi:hypothetical protein [Klebsiella pneumoniae]|uniref:hypothetical protein n=1 Tax=Klebsiella pneumoniae TaxID=573 RepID=UPI00197D438E|nr:hypothetical protein [Klebsiella pneumoniae]HCI6957719.1 hypothetical protein [Klebsiella pneumoniae]